MAKVKERRTSQKAKRKRQTAKVKRTKNKSNGKTQKANGKSQKNEEQSPMPPAAPRNRERTLSFRAERGILLWFFLPGCPSTQSEIPRSARNDRAFSEQFKWQIAKGKWQKSKNEEQVKWQIAKGKWQKSKERRTIQSADRKTCSNEPRADRASWVCVFNFQLRFSSFKLRVSNFDFPISIFQFPISSFDFPVSNFGFPISIFQLRFSSCQFPASVF
jgi:hypothetical protein